MRSSRQMKNIITEILILLCGIISMTACNDAADGSDSDAAGKKGVSFTMDLADWEAQKTIGAPITKAAPQQQSTTLKTIHVNLTPEVSANVSIVSDEQQTDHSATSTRAAKRKALAIGDYTIIAYQGTDAAPMKKAELKVKWDGSTFTINNEQAKMRLEPGTYTFVCFNDKLEEKNGKLSMVNYDRNKSLSSDEDHADYLKTLAADYDEALVGRVTANVTDTKMKVPFVLSHPWARVKFVVGGMCLKRPDVDKDYSTTGSVTNISYNADLSGTATMIPSSEGGAVSTPQTLSAHELNPLSLTPVAYTESEVDLASGAEKLNNKRVFKFDNFIEYRASEFLPWMNGYTNKFQEYQSMNLYFPAGAMLKEYKWLNGRISLYGRQSSFDKLYLAVRDALPPTLQANSSYKVFIHVSYNFRYLFGDGTVGTLAENNNWANKRPIAIVTSMKTRTAMSLEMATGRVNWTKVAPNGHFNRRYYTMANANDMVNDMDGYRTTYDPAYTYEGITPHAENPNLPAFYVAARYKAPGTTASWILNPSPDVNDSRGKWYLPSIGEWIQAYHTVGHGTGYDINQKQKTGPKYDKWMEWRITLLDIGFRQAGSSIPPSWNYQWSSNELVKDRENNDYAVQVGWRNDGTFIFRRDNYNQGIVVPFIHF